MYSSSTLYFIPKNGKKNIYEIKLLCRINVTILFLSGKLNEPDRRIWFKPFVERKGNKIDEILDEKFDFRWLLSALDIELMIIVGFLFSLVKHIRKKN